MSAASALMLATEASRSVAARRIFILELEERKIRLKSCVVFLAWLLFEIYELYGIEHVRARLGHGR
jgi:hypothetical protein